MTELKEMSILERKTQLIKMLPKHQEKTRGRVRRELKMESGKGKGPDMKVALKETCKYMKPSTSVK